MQGNRLLNRFAASNARTRIFPTGMDSCRQRVGTVRSWEEVVVLGSGREVPRQSPARHRTTLPGHRDQRGGRGMAGQQEERQQGRARRVTGHVPDIWATQPQYCPKQCLGKSPCTLPGLCCPAPLHGEREGKGGIGHGHGEKAPWRGTGETKNFLGENKQKKREE